MATVSEKERRVFDRFDARFPAKLKDSREDFGEKLYLRNASAQGALIASKENIYLNDSLTLEISVPHSVSPVTIRGRVVWAKKDMSSFWDVGLKFHQISFMHLSRLYEAANPTQV